jgi:outer membrane protein
MKQFSLILNLVLLLAVSFLFYKVFSTDKKQTNSAKIVSKDSSGNATASLAIAYVELDSLNENITFIKNKQQEFERKQRAIEEEWKSGMTGIQNRVAEFKRSTSAKTQQEVDKLQMELGQQQQNIEGKKQEQTQILSKESYSFLENIQKQLKEYMAEYNKDKKYQYILTSGSGADFMIYKDESNNITNDVIEGMNLKLNAKK